MNTQHTPGPWHIKKISTITDYFNNGQQPITAHIYAENIVKDGETIHTPFIAELHFCRTDEELKANARLIAAAPELLENLARIIDRIEESGLQDNFPSAYQRAKAAIQKATQ